MKGKKLFVVLAALLAMSPLVYANGLNLNSLGSRALAMGGAFTGLADDFSAVYWNPAGLGFFKEKTIGFYGVDIIPSGTYSLSIPSPYYLMIPPYVQTPVDAKTKTQGYLGGMAAYIHPISENIVAGIGVYTPAGLGASWDGTQLSFVSGGNTTIEWKSKIGLVTIAPTLAFKVNDMLSLGAQININYGMFDISMYAGQVAPPLAPVTVDLGQYTESETGWGVGATFGVLFKPTSLFSVGAMFRTASKISFSGTAEISNLPLLGYKGSSDMKRDVTWPEEFTAGLALKPIDPLAITADLHWTHWKRIDEFKTTYTDPSWSALMSLSGKDVMAMHWDDAIQIRFGAEYQVSRCFALRGGYYIDPSPAPDRTMNILLPNYDFTVATFGIGYTFDSLRIDLGVEYLVGKDRSIDFLKTFYYAGLNPLYDPDYADAMPGKYGMKILAPNISISYRFGPKS
jgi:long-chain fatty acid transport protein